MKYVHSAVALSIAIVVSGGAVSKAVSGEVDEGIEEVIVTSSFVGQKVSDIENPLHIVSGEDIANDATASLGESLDDLLGVASADYGAATGQPIIRGMSGTRVKVLHNGMVNRDVTGLGADHPNDIDLSHLEQIEIVRGPSSLLYANGTIGGIINVVDKTIARENLTQSDFRFGIESQSVNDGETAEFSYQNNIGGLNLSVSFKDADFGNFDIPRGAVIHAEEEHHDEDGEDHDDDHDEGHDEGHDEHANEAMGVLSNSDFDSQSKRIGISKVGDWGYVGMSFSNNESVYGIPYHGEETGEGHGDEHGDEHEGERIFSTTDADKFDLRGSFNLGNGLVKQVDVFFRDSDYSLTEQHAEGEAHAGQEHEGEDHEGEEHEGEEHEGEEHGDEHHAEGPTTFASESQEFGATFDLSNDLFSQKIVLNYLDSDTSIVGHEAFMNPASSEELTIGYFFSRDFDAFTLDVGIRHDRLSKKGSVTHRDEHGDDDDHGDEHDDDHGDEHDDEHDDEHGDEHADEESHEIDYFNNDFDNTSVALSLGRQLNDSISITLGLALVERAPSNVELFMNGPHLATGRFEVGNVALESEKSNNVDFSINYQSGEFFAGLTLFKNDVDSYIYLQDETDEEHEEHSDDHAGMIEANYLQKDAEFEGYEFEIGRNIALDQGTLSLMYGRDSVRAKFKDGTNVPRMVPTRNMLSMVYAANDLKVKLTFKDVEKQNDIALNETSTSSHQMLDLQLTRSFQFKSKAEIALTLYAKNLLDEAARNHSSFVKDQVPLPGKNFGIRLSGKF